MRSLRIVPALLLTAATVLLSSTRPSTTNASTPRHPLSLHPSSTFSIPASNVSSAGPVLDEHHIVYAVASPRMHARTCVSCGDAPFTAFHMQVYLRLFQAGYGGIVASQPRQFFTGPRGAQIAFLAFQHNWLIYETFDRFTQWTLFARNVVSGHRVLLDSPRREGTPSNFTLAGTDGSRVVWQSWTYSSGKTLSVIRSYAFATGQRRLLVAGGSDGGFFYSSPKIAGNRLVFTRDFPDGTAQILLKNIANGYTRMLTPRGQTNFEPSIAGNVLVWVHGRISLGHTHGLVVMNLATGQRVALRHSATQLPRIAAGRYVVFATDHGRTSIQVYDTLTHQRRTINVGPASGQAYGTGEVEAGGRAILFALSGACGASLCPTRFTLLPLA